MFARGADPRACDLANSKAPPSAEHWFGFDQQGCDYLANVVYGARNSLIIGLLSRARSSWCWASSSAPSPATSAACTDSVLSRLTDIFFALPLILGALVLLRVGPSTGCRSSATGGRARSRSRWRCSAG